MLLRVTQDNSLMQADIDIMNKSLMFKIYIALMFFILGIILVIYPSIDIYVSGLFYDHQLGFVYNDHPTLVMLTYLTPIMIKASLLFFIVYLFFVFWNKKEIL